MSPTPHMDAAFEMLGRAMLAHRVARLFLELKPSPAAAADFAFATLVVENHLSLVSETERLFPDEARAYEAQHAELIAAAQRPPRREIVLELEETA